METEKDIYSGVQILFTSPLFSLNLQAYLEKCMPPKDTITKLVLD